MLAAHRRTHRDAGRQTLVHEDDRSAANNGRRVFGAVALFPACLLPHCLGDRRVNGLAACSQSSIKLQPLERNARVSCKT
jgi:hypothetical protein